MKITELSILRRHIMARFVGHLLPAVIARHWWKLRGIQQSLLSFSYKIASYHKTHDTSLTTLKLQEQICGLKVSGSWH